MADLILPIIKVRLKDWTLEWEDGCRYLQWHLADRQLAWRFLMTDIYIVLEGTTEQCAYQRVNDTIQDEMCGNLLLRCIQEGDLVHTGSNMMIRTL